MLPAREATAKRCSHSATREQALLAATRGKPAAQQRPSAVKTKLKERKVTDEYYLSLQFASFYSVVQDMEQGRNTTWALFRGRVWQLRDQCCIYMWTSCFACLLITLCQQKPFLLQKHHNGDLSMIVWIDMSLKSEKCYNKLLTFKLMEECAIREKCV